MERGRVTLIATDARLGDVLAEWSRVGDTRFVGAERNRQRADYAAPDRRCRSRGDRASAPYGRGVRRRAAPRRRVRRLALRPGHHSGDSGRTVTAPNRSGGNVWGRIPRRCGGAVGGAQPDGATNPGIDGRAAATTRRRGRRCREPVRRRRNGAAGHPRGDDPPSQASVRVPRFRPCRNAGGTGGAERPQIILQATNGETDRWTPLRRSRMSLMRNGFAALHRPRRT